MSVRLLRNPHAPGTRRAYAWDRGWRSFKDGVLFGSNPYGFRPGQTYMRLEWTNGWRAARDSEGRS